MTSVSYAGPSVFGYETDHLRRVASISVHTSPLATLGGKDAGGMNVYVRELSCHTAHLDLPVDVFTRRTDPETPEVVEICEGVNLISICAGPPTPLDKNLLFDLLPEFAEQMALYSLRAGVRYDVIHAHYWLSGWTAHLLERYWNTPFSLMFHTTAHMKNIVSPESEHETTLRAEIENKLVGLADSIIAANPDEAADLIWRQHCPSEKICTIPPGVDTRLFRPLDRSACRAELGIGPDEHVVLFVGRIDPIKGLDTLLEATAFLKSSGSLARVHLIGGELDDRHQPIGQLARLVERARVLGVADRLVLWGSQPQDRLPVFYSAADVVSVPSRYESFGLVAVEAMACGIPVVASRAGGLIFTVEDGRTGYLAPIGDGAEHGRRMLELLTDPQKCAAFSCAAREGALRFSWEAVATSVVHVYERLADGHRANLCGDEEIFASAI
ncbi:MAG TPA: glycosyltransferase [Thermomicrobiales bacterium]|nr:glycosyltransferase [Thermomicrobiales bacterium]